MSNSCSQLEQQKSLLISAFSHSNEGMILTDLDTTIIGVNQAFCRMSGYEEHQLLGKTPRILQSGFHDAIFYEEMWNTIKARGHWQGEIWDRKKDGELSPKQISIKTIHNSDGSPLFYMGLMTDHTQLATLTRLANHDPLTSLANRRLFKQRLAHDMAHADRYGKKIALLYIDLDRFKHINDSCGHRIGDELLVQVARRLQCAVRAEDTVSRRGGDEFIIILPEVKSVDAVKRVGIKIINKLNQPFMIQAHHLNIGCSIGYSIYPEHSANVDHLIHVADSAMYRAKQAGRNRLCC